MVRLPVLAFVLLAAIGWLTPADALDFTDSLGRKVAIPDTVSRVLPAGPPAAVAIYTVAPEKMVGWVRPLTDDQKAFITETYRNLPVAGRLTGKEGDLDTAAVKKLKPDLIIDVGDLDPQYRALADKIQRETGIPYVVLDGSLAQMPELYGQLSKLLNTGVSGDMLMLLSASELARAKVLKSSAKQPAKIYFAYPPGGMSSGGMGGMGGVDAQVLDALGAMNVAGHQTVTPGQLAERKPDIVLTADADLAKTLRNDPAWMIVPAIAAGKVYTVPGVPFGWLGTPPSVNRLIGLEWLSTLLYPEQTKRDLAADTRGFYRSFYHVELTDAQLDALLHP